MLKTAGGVKCWGSNGAGELGDNTRVNKLTSVWVVGFMDGDPDNDGIDNAIDTDDDGDTVGDISDNCSLDVNLDQINTDGDTQGNACDTDDDNDGVLDAFDSLPLNVAASVDDDQDGVPTSWNAACDVTCQSNSGLVLDNCPSVVNADQLNTDGDTLGNVCDLDNDNDGDSDASRSVNGYRSIKCR